MSRFCLLTLRDRFVDLSFDSCIVTALMFMFGGVQCTLVRVFNNFVQDFNAALKASQSVRCHFLILSVHVLFFF